MAFEYLHSIARKKTGKKGLMALKLDMSEAYDKVEWNFLQAVMLKMKFPLSLIDLIMDCISTSTLRFYLMEFQCAR